jgi:cyclophilin family peptidyl-prolyl cis-trans isomerase
LLAADTMTDLLPGCLGVDEPIEQIVAVGDPGPAVQTLTAEGEGAAEGEDQPDLVAFAKALEQAGVKFYGAAWCSACTEQKELFEDGAHFLPFIEVTNPDRTLNQAGIDANVSSLPTWEFPDQTRLTELQTLETISQRSGVPIPTSSTPSLAPIDDVTLLGGSPLHIPLDGYDPNGDPLTYSITITGPDSAQVSWTILEGNRSLEIDASTYGKMVFQLFEGRAGRPTERVIGLAQDGFYDGVIFHRVIDGFMIQGGGTAGSTLGDFDDQFHVELQHNRIGTLSYANSPDSDDSNDSQFFVTLGPERHLDFNHSVFGILVEGYEQLVAINSVPTDDNDKPDTDVPMNSVDVFTDTENGVLMLSAPEGLTGEVEVTVTVSDGQNSSQQTFSVDVLPDVLANGGANGGPFLEDIDPVTVPQNGTANIQLSAIDVEGDAVYYGAGERGSVDYTYDIDHDTGELTVTPPAGFVGEMEILVGVRAFDTAATDTQDPWDTQLLTIDVTPVPVLDLLAASDSNIDTDNITNLTSLTFRVTNVDDGATVEILNEGTVIAEGTADGTSIDLTTDALSQLGDGVYTLTAVQTVGGEVGDPSAELQITLDTTISDFSSTAPGSGIVGHFLVYDAQHPEEGPNSVTYALSGGPDGATIDAKTGVMTWTPTASQAGTNAFQIVATDTAGNSIAQEVSIDVLDVEQWMQVRLEITNLDGTIVDTVNVGQDFWLNVYVKDVRTEDAEGVFASYMDINYDWQLASAVGQDRDDIEFGDKYKNGRSGDLTPPGLLDEVGSFGPTSPLDDSEYLQMSIRMTADAVGDILFYADPAEDIGHDPLVFGYNSPFSWDAVTFLPITLAIAEGGLIAEDDLYNVDEDSSNVLDLLTNDTNELGGTPVITGVGPTSHNGTVTIAADGQSVTYEPADNFFGEETFTYTVVLDGVESTGEVTVQVFPMNDAPTADDDEFTISNDTEDNFLDVLDNDDIDPDQNETLRVIDVGTPAHGTVEIAPNGTHLIYTPDPGFVGQDMFTYEISDGTGSGALTSEATVTVTVDDTPRPDAVDDDDTTVQEDSGPVVIDVLANDSPEQAGASLEVVAVGPAASGSQVVVSGGGATVTYTPAPDFQGTDTFTYTVLEEGGGTSIATVTVEVTNLNDPPTATDDEFNVVKDGGLTELDVLDNDSILPDPDGTLTITSVTQGSDGGTVEISSDGLSIEYTHDGYEGTETFTYTIDDGSGETAEASVTVHVRPYVPRSVSGKAMLTARGELGGVSFGLSGTDAFATDVQLAFDSRLVGDYLFADLAPGSYTIESHSLAFLIDGGVMELLVQSELDDGDTTGLDFEYLGRKANHMALSDLLVTAPNQSPLSVDHSVVVAIEPGGSQLWYLRESGWDEYVDGEFQLSEDQTEITLTATESDGDRVRGTIDATDSSLVRWLAREGDAYLMRITASPDKFDFQPANDGSQGGEAEGESEAEAEGESPVVSAAQAAAERQPTPTPSPITVTTTLDDVVGEGEADVASGGSPVITTLASSAIEQSTVSVEPQAQAIDVASFADLQADSATSETPLSTPASSVEVSADDSDEIIAAIDTAITDSAFEDEIRSSILETAESDDVSEVPHELAIDAALADESLWVLA